MKTPTVSCSAHCVRNYRKLTITSFYFTNRVARPSRRKKQNRQNIHKYIIDIYETIFLYVYLPLSIHLFIHFSVVFQTPILTSKFFRLHFQPQTTVYVRSEFNLILNRFGGLIKCLFIGWLLVAQTPILTPDFFSIFFFSNVLRIKI